MAGRDKERKAQDILYWYYYNKTIKRKNSYTIIPNIKLFGWEDDLIVVSKTGLITSIEIKNSRQDFLNEFKYKRKSYSTNRNKYKTPNRNEYKNDFHSRNKYRSTGLKEYKYSVLESSFKPEPKSLAYTPNYFYIAVTGKFLKLREIPNYVGLIHIKKTKIKLTNKSFFNIIPYSDGNSYTVKIIRKAEKLHKQKITDRNRDYITNGLSIRFWNSRLGR